jgi:hypothetical protein
MRVRKRYPVASTAEVTGLHQAAAVVDARSLVLVGEAAQLGHEVRMTTVTVRPADRLVVRAGAVVVGEMSARSVRRGGFGTGVAVASVVLGAIVGLAGTGFWLGAAGVGVAFLKTTAVVAGLGLVAVLALRMRHRCHGIHCGGCRR